MKHYRRKNNRCIFRIHKRLDGIERRLKAFFNCPFCGFDQGKPDPYFGTGLTPTFMKLVKGADTGAETTTETAMEQMSESYDLYHWLNGKTDKRPPIADKVLEKLLSSTKAADSEKESLKYMREFFKTHPNILQAVKPEDIPTARECTCRGRSMSDCPRHGKLKLNIMSTPDPLNVRVAKALGKEVVFEGKWYQASKELNDRFELIPDYSNDLVAAMGVLEEYLTKLKQDFDKSDGATDIAQARIDCFIIPGKQEYTVHIADYSICGQSNSEARAICLAITAHAEGE